jgi:phytol kinase
MLMVEPWIGIGIVLATGIAIMATLGAWKSNAPAHPELKRKLLHMGIGFLALSFPWLFDSAWPVLLVAGAGAAILLAAKFSNAIGRHLGSGLWSVSRASWGEFYFLFAVAALFVVSEGKALFYATPLLVLTLADAAAALVGVRFGRVRFGAREGAKSLEGSAAFFAFAFASTAAALCLLGTHDVPQMLMVAGLLAAATTVLEAAARKGLDNLAVPAGAYFVLASVL